MVRIPLTAKTEKKVKEAKVETVTVTKEKIDMSQITQELAILRHMVEEQQKAISTLQSSMEKMQKELINLKTGKVRDTSNINKAIASNPLWGKVLFNDSGDDIFDEKIGEDKVEETAVEETFFEAIQPAPVEEPKYNPDVLRIVKRHTKNSALIRRIAECVKETNQVPTKEQIYQWGDGISGANVNKIYTELQEVV